MKWDFKMVVLIVELSLFQGMVLKWGFTVYISVTSYI